MKTRTRGTVNEATFKQVKELQKMGASAGKAGKFVGLSPSTTSRMFNNETFAQYREFVANIPQNKARVEAYSKSLSPSRMPDITSKVPNDTQLLTKAINRLADALEESNAKKKSIW
jgi:DNA-binding MurR/RpiR family transcriptional regulator